ncbi:hypothetical protein LJC49_07340, partial [Ruminococcaceae bacterium OttesenSCG-928-I18]|nr:hypothetical protein [Ruminococcaceae bacterium OttesenSCG-928-I18]
MICSNCKKLVLHNEVIRKNIKGFENVDISYDAVCPFCHAMMGRMFWGKLMAGGQQAEAAILKRPAEEKPPVRYCCPHCGKVLPQDLGELPEYRERRQKDRRVGDRRKLDLSMGGLD